VGFLGGVRVCWTGVVYGHGVDVFGHGGSGW
jgi:hypothetical protein